MGGGKDARAAVRAGLDVRAELWIAERRNYQSPGREFFVTSLN
jgi:hypothetical protein